MMTYYKGNETGMAVGLLPDPYYWWLAGAMFDQMVQYWYYTGDSTYNEVVTQGLLAQISEDKDFMPRNQTKTEVDIDFLLPHLLPITDLQRGTTIKLSGLLPPCPPPS